MTLHPRQHDAPFFFRRSFRAVKANESYVIDAITLIPLRRRQFTFVIIAQRVMTSKQSLENFFCENCHTFWYGTNLLPLAMHIVA
jgi:hypothetical protein